VRILTLYLYLNDVEEGGGTNFDELDITVMPKRGRALLWPSVLDSDPDKKDGRTTHQALPVGKGSIKYGANVRMDDVVSWLYVIKCGQVVLLTD
jgi:prolyl 4-hydroxylase